MCNNKMIQLTFQKHECKTTYQKDCFVESRPKASSVNTQICHTNSVRDCNTVDRSLEQICTEEYDTGNHPF